MWRALVLLFVVSICLRANAEVYNVTIVDLIPTTQSSDVTGSRIIGGQATTIENFPYTVQVLYNGQLSCAGSLLTSIHVLSAAHCFVDGYGVLVNTRFFTIRAGSTNLNTGGALRNVQNIVVHPGYNSPPRDNDIAVLRLDRSYTLSNSIAVASIPRQGAVVPDNSTVIHVGWGRTNVHIPIVSTVLQQVSVYTVNRQVCAARYAYLQSQIGEPFPVTNNMICAGVLDVGGRDACQGDSGGPLIYSGIVMGVTSWGYGCAEPLFPGVSAGVSSYTNWITNVVQNGAADRHASAITLIVSLISSLTLIARSLS